MSFGSNIQYFRKLTGGMTQERLAERMGVSRQTVSKWESEEAYPEVPKLLELCNVFSCTLDSLLREDLAARLAAYSDVRIQTVPAFTMGRYVIISPNPEDDVIAYMKAWAQRSGLNDAPGEHALIGWDFPFVSAEQQSRFGLRGYAAAYILPDDFKPQQPGVEIASQSATEYAVITVTDPFVAAFDRIPNAYKQVMEYLKACSARQDRASDALPCFERVYEKDGVQYMDIHVRVCAPR